MKIRSRDWLNKPPPTSLPCALAALTPPRPAAAPSYYDSCFLQKKAMASEAPAPKEALTSPPPIPPRCPPSDKMKRILGLLAIFAYFLSLPVLGFGIWLLATREYECEDLLRMPAMRIGIGVGLLFLFVISNVVVYYGRRVLIPGNSILSIALVVMLTVGLSLVGTYKMEARGVPASPMWLRERVARGDIWNNIKACLYDNGICAELTYRTIQFTSYEFSMAKLSHIEAGCCKPPDACGMVYVNATYWNAAGSKDGRESRWIADPAVFSSFGDCHIWSNEFNELCYDCYSCKMGFLKAITSRWRKTGIFLIVMSVLLVAVHSVRFILMMITSERYK